MTQPQKDLTLVLSHLAKGSDKDRTLIHRNAHRLLQIGASGLNLVRNRPVIEL